MRIVHLSWVTFHLWHALVYRILLGGSYSTLYTVGKITVAQTNMIAMMQGHISVSPLFSMIWTSNSLEDASLPPSCSYYSYYYYYVLHIDRKYTSVDLGHLCQLQQWKKTQIIEENKRENWNLKPKISNKKFCYFSRELQTCTVYKAWIQLQRLKRKASSHYGNGTQLKEHNLTGSLH